MYEYPGIMKWPLFFAKGLVYPQNHRVDLGLSCVYTCHVYLYIDNKVFFLVSDLQNPNEIYHRISGHGSSSWIRVLQWASIRRCGSTPSCYMMRVVSCSFFQKHPNISHNLFICFCEEGNPKQKPFSNLWIHCGSTSVFCRLPKVSWINLLTRMSDVSTLLLFR